MWRSLIVGLSLLSFEVRADASPRSPVPTDLEIGKILAERIDAQKQSLGIVVGVLEPHGRRIVGWGRLAHDDPRSPDGDTVFEIGSVTKVFTALLLADMVERGELELGDSVAKHLPERVVLPRRDDRDITLRDLATHSSGLPRLPDNLAPENPANPYADYSLEQLYGFLSGYRLTREVGELYEYSNLGYGLLGHVLALRGGTDYESLIRTRISAPLAMSSTVVALTQDLKSRLAIGHDPALQAVQNWDFPTLAGAGALRSTAEDLLNFLEMALGTRPLPLASAFERMLTIRRPIGAPGFETALGWVIDRRGEDEMIWHNGGTGGYRSFVGFLPEAKVGVVVLSNTSTELGVDDIGQHLLDPDRPLAPPPRRVVAVDPNLYDRLVGRYRLEPDFILTVTRDGDRLFAQATGQSKAELFPESELDFFYRIVDAQVTFETDGTGRAVRLILHQNGRSLPAPRIDE